MIYELSNMIVTYLEKNIILDHDREIYIHGCNMIISTGIGTILIIFIGILINRLFIAFIYELVMSSSRCILGGYHCSSHKKCIILYVTLFCAGIFLERFIYVNFVSICAINILSIIIVCEYNPVQNINKIISKQKFYLFKKLSLLYIFLHLFIINYLYFTDSIFLNNFIYMIFVIHILTVGGTYELKKNIFIDNF